MGSRTGPRPAEGRKGSRTTATASAGRQEEAFLHGSARVGRYGGADSGGGKRTGDPACGDAIAGRGLGRTAATRLLSEGASGGSSRGGTLRPFGRTGRQAVGAGSQSDKALRYVVSARAQLYACYQKVQAV